MICKGCRFRAVCLALGGTPDFMYTRVASCRECRNVWLFRGNVKMSLRLEWLSSVYTICSNMWEAADSTMTRCPKCDGGYSFFNVTRDHKSRVTVCLDDQNRVEQMLLNSFTHQVWLPYKGWQSIQKGEYDARMPNM